MWYSQCAAAREALAQRRAAESVDPPNESDSSAPTAQKRAAKIIGECHYDFGKIVNLLSNIELLCAAAMIAL